MAERMFDVAKSGTMNCFKQMIVEAENIRNAQNSWFNQALKQAEMEIYLAQIENVEQDEFSFVAKLKAQGLTDEQIKMQVLCAVEQEVGDKLAFLNATPASVLVEAEIQEETQQEIQEEPQQEIQQVEEEEVFVVVDNGEIEKPQEVKKKPAKRPVLIDKITIPFAEDCLAVDVITKVRLFNKKEQSKYL